MSQRLRIEVERIVRPVRAPLERKMRMREELLAHVEAALAEELSRGVNEDAALDRALGRLGPPAELTAELQHSLTRQERFETWVNGWSERRPGESPSRMALRIAAAVFVFMVVIAPLALLLRGLDDADTVPRMLGLLAVTTMLVVDVFLVSWLGVRSHDAAGRTAPISRWPGSVWASAVASGVIVCGMGLTVMFVVSRGEAPSRQVLGQWLLIGAVAVAAFIAVLAAVHWEHRRSSDWDSLDLDSAG